jgi:putative oxidoreductase
MNNMKNLIQRGLHMASLVDRLQPLLLLAARLYVSLIFFRAGMLKLADWSSTLVLFRETYKVPVLPPELAAYVGTFGELAFPVLIALGLAGRLGAAGLFVVNVMAVASYLDLFGFECPAGINSHYYWGSILLALMVFGPGKISVDEFILQRFGLKRARPGSRPAAAIV